jgi:3(or 17)beta-hydroxysteroid dehydrogenase
MHTSKRLNNKIILITGAARGIGAATAKLFAEEGGTIIVTDILDALGQEVAKNIGANALYHHLDVRYEKDWDAVFQMIQTKYQRLDVLVNNAGITGLNVAGTLHDPEHLSLDSWQDVHDVNLKGTVLGCKYAIGVMKKHGGSIINMSSRSGIVGIPRASAYASSKAAIRNHTKTVALYCAEERYNIRCNSIHPAAILTPMWDVMLGEGKKRAEMIAQIGKDIPLRKMGEPIDVAYAALYLASDESKYITGSEFHVDGGILAGSAAVIK